MAVGHSELYKKTGFGPPLSKGLARELANTNAEDHGIIGPIAYGRLI